MLALAAVFRLMRHCLEGICPPVDFMGNYRVDDSVTVADLQRARVLEHPQR